MASERNAVYCTLLLSDTYLPGKQLVSSRLFWCWRVDLMVEPRLGAMVLAHSLRDNGTRAKLIVLYTPDQLQQATINELRTVYDEMIPVSSLVNGTPANLWLMDRPDLIATFTKIELWRLTQFSRIVYIDCDVVALRAPDELLSLEADFAAAPDVGWPDCFNSGLMALRPNLQDYYALKALAERGISFDGADQGLLNMHFRDWHRLSFTYNCTPSANYQYIPAYKHFESTISLIHFIGAQKPWNLPRQVVPLQSPYNQLLGRWWSVYDKHYRPPFVSTSRLATGVPLPVQDTSIPQGASYSSGTDHFGGQPGEAHGGKWPEHQHVQFTEAGSASFPGGVAQVHQDVSAPGSVDQQMQHLPAREHFEPHPDTQHAHHAGHDITTSAGMAILSAVPQYVRGEEQVSTYIPPLPHARIPAFQIQRDQHSYHQEPQTHQEHHSQSQSSEPDIHHPQPVAPLPPADELHQAPPPLEPEVPTFEAPKAEWDASREPPPLNTKPEGVNLQQKTYTMSEDTSLFQPPPSYPEAPKNMYYQVPSTKPASQQLNQIFPWESHAPKPTRIFAQEQPIPLASPPEPTIPLQASDLPPLPETSPLRAPYEPSAETFESYTRSNAWDEDPDIQRYIESIQQTRRARTQVISGSSQPSTSTRSSQDLSGSSTTTLTGPVSGHRPSIILTDFPTEVERPSLPVTPAPIQRNWGSGGGEEDHENDASGTAALPAAEGVPSQEDWVGVTFSEQHTYCGGLQNPLASLEELHRRQSEVLEHPERLDERLAAFAGESESP
ncbi:uncharacterized protein N7482_008376 [Penicillium canariense]|uniref:glycogenin glucosyltransferase n=1 Tax=Penicillium canariense TaxID=189055 RepID=A0A9W9HTP7_9EURO|nr:uncharacterized protein N7482_008376 [Penicillium canariense]KAJ5157276.1 hypothetical protein N7482_008376 [Penicillium canariense]